MLSCSVESLLVQIGLLNLLRRTSAPATDRPVVSPPSKKAVWERTGIKKASCLSACKKGAALGWMALIVNGEETARIELEADSDVERTTFFAAFVKVLSDWPAGALL